MSIPHSDCIGGQENPGVTIRPGGGWRGGSPPNNQ